MENIKSINFEAFIKAPTPIDEGSKQVIQAVLEYAMNYFIVLAFLVRIVDEDLLKNTNFDPSDELFDVLSIAHIYLKGVKTNNKIDEKSVDDFYRKLYNRFGNFDNVIQNM